jgi:hypothetical protein
MTVTKVAEKDVLQRISRVKKGIGFLIHNTLVKIQGRWWQQRQLLRR